LKSIDELNLEETMKWLEETVAKLENTDISLEKSISVFEEGVKLSTRAKKLLDEYNGKITVLKKENGILTEKESNIGD